MRVLVTWGTKHQGTEGIARIVGRALQREDFDVELLPAERATSVEGFDAVIVGGALYANRWHPAARRFVLRQAKALRRVPVWFFSSGPLDDSAARELIPPTRQVQGLMDVIGARGHMTFGGRLSPFAQGFPARAMARTRAGDWRQPPLIRAWAADIARELPTARPGVPAELRGASLARLLSHALAGWLVSAAVFGSLLVTTSATTALVVRLLVAPLVFGAVGWRYFQIRGARSPAATALVFTTVVAFADLAFVGFVEGSVAVLRSMLGSFVPWSLVLAATWVTGLLASMMPSPKEAHG